MTAPETMTDCPTEETLAAFIDHRLTGEARTRVIAHLTECGDCREIVLMANDFAAVDEPSAVEAPEVDPRFRRWMWPSIAAAAAAIAVVFFIPRDPMKKLIDASNKIDSRTVNGRLTGFPYKPAKIVYRSGGEAKAIDISLSPIYTAAADIADHFAHDDSVKAKHDVGVANLVAGERPAATQLLRAALLQETHESDLTKAIARSTDAALLNDLSVTYLQEGGDATKIALQAAERSLQIRVTAEATWNRAAALQDLNRDAEALKAWQQYLLLDPSSAWSAEAHTKIENLTPEP